MEPPAARWPAMDADPSFNRAVHEGKLEAIRRVQRLRSGWSPSDAQVASINGLVNAWDAIDPAVSRNLLAHLRRLADDYAGNLPAAACPRASAAVHFNPLR